MEPKIAEYRGYRIRVTPMEDHENRWDFAYQIEDIADAAARPLVLAQRSQTMDGYETPETACDAGVEVAKTEIDNHLAMH